MIDVTDRSKLAALIPGEAFLKANRAFQEGDHWQKGEGWIGPMPADGAEGASAVALEIEAGFTSKNVVAEITERHTVGVVGREPAFNWTPREAVKKGTPIPQNLQDDIFFLNSELTIWWNEKRVHDVIRDITTDSLWAGRAMARIFVPLSRLRVRAFNSTGKKELVIRTRDFREALSHIWIEHTIPENSTVYEDPDTKERIGIFVHTTTMPDGSSKTQIEAVWTNGELTMIRVFGETEAESTTAVLNLGGRITMYEMRRPLLITPQVVSQQKALNLAISMLPRNVITGGFLERIILNAQMPGEWVDIGEGKPKKFVPDPFYVGAGTTNILQGTQFTDTGTDGQQKVHLATPSVHFREPVDGGPTIGVIDAHYRMMLEEADQSHILIQGEAVASGKSREQARADFMSSLSLSNTRIEEMGRWVLEGVTAFAEHLTGQPGRYTSKLRATFKCRLDAGALNADERRQAMESGDAGYLSKETVQIALGVDDTDAENALIESQPGWNLRFIKDQATALSLILGTGISPVEALALVGIEDPDGTLAAGITQKQAEVKQAAADALKAKTAAGPNLNNAPKGKPAKRGASRQPPKPGQKVTRPPRK